MTKRMQLLASAATSVLFLGSLALSALAAPPSMQPPEIVNIVPTQGPVLEGRLQALGGPHLIYYGGPVISNVRIVMVIYGAGTYPDDIVGSGIPSMQSFYQQVVDSPYMDWLCEYNTPSQSIGRGVFDRKIQITPNPSRNGDNIGDQTIRDELASQIDAGHLPPPDANTVYMIHFRHGQSITMQGRRSCMDFLGYHSNFKHNGVQVYYGVMPDLASCPCWVCGGLYLALATRVASHELVEAITDPEPNSAWFDPNPGMGEIGDICANMPATLQGSDGAAYTVQLEWSNLLNDCIAVPASPKLVLPSNSAQCQPVNGALSWTAATDAFGYHLQLGTSPACGQSLLVDTGVVGTTYSYGPLQPNTTYFWRTSDWTPSSCGSTTPACYSFTTSPAVPASPALVSPPDGAANQPLAGVLEWSDVPGASGYHVSIRCPSGVVVASGSPVQSNFSYNLAPATYTWLVNGYNACGQAGAASQTQTFTVGAGSICGVPVLQSPADGDTCQLLSGTLHWDPIPGATGYVLNLREGGNCENAGSDISVGTNAYTYNGLHSSRTYIWRVRQACPCAVFAACRSFTTVPDVNQLHAPPLQSPANGSQNQLAAGTLNWNANSHAASYIVQLGTSCGSGPEQAVTGPNYDYSGLSQATTYFWRVRARDNCGQQSAYSNCFSFKTEALTGIDRYYVPAGLTYAVGETLATIPIRAENLSPLREFDLNVTIDPNTFEYLGWTLAGTRAEGASSVDAQYDSRTGRLQVRRVIVPPTGSCPPSIGAGDGEIFKIQARVRQTAVPGTTPLRLQSGSPNRFVDCTGHNYTPTVFSGEAMILGGAVGVPPLPDGLDGGIALAPASPSPARGRTVLRFGSRAQQWVRLTIFDVAGRELARPVDGTQSEGWHEVVWDLRDHAGRNVPPGVYFVRLDGAGQTRRSSIVILH